MKVEKSNDKPSKYQKADWRAQDQNEDKACIKLSGD